MLVTIRECDERGREIDRMSVELSAAELDKLVGLNDRLRLEAGRMVYRLDSFGHVEFACNAPTGSTPTGRRVLPSTPL